jgi:hypothetical protein
MINSQEELIAPCTTLMAISSYIIRNMSHQHISLKSALWLLCIQLFEDIVEDISSSTNTRKSSRIPCTTRLFITTCYLAHYPTTLGLQETFDVPQSTPSRKYSGPPSLLGDPQKCESVLGQICCKAGMVQVGIHTLWTAQLHDERLPRDSPHESVVCISTAHKRLCIMKMRQTALG